MKKLTLIFLALAICLLCMSFVSAESAISDASTASPGTVAISSGLPLLKAQEETTTETTEETFVPTVMPTEETTQPTEQPTIAPTEQPTIAPTEETSQPTEQPTIAPTEETTQPTVMPTEETTQPTEPTLMPTTEETTSPIPGPYAPVADFSASPTSGSGPLTVSFHDASINNPTMWSWDFGDGSSGGMTGAPTHTYTDPGTYTVTMTASNQYGTDTITKTDLVTVNGQVMSNGAIYAQSVPSGATIYLNGNSQGTSPLTMNNLLPGTYTIMATLNGYNSNLQAITVYSGRTAGYYPSLTPSPNPPVTPGSIYAQSSPAGAGIYLSGVYYGTSPITINNLPPGSYSVMAYLSGYSADTRVIQVYSGQSSSYYPTLQPSSGPTGAIYAQSSPDGAAIYLNGQYYGTSPITLPNLAPGIYTMKGSLAGYSDDTERISVSAGHTSFYTPIFHTSPPPIGSGQGIVAVYSNVDGAQVYFDNTFEGNITGGVLYVPVYTTGTPVQNYRVENFGYIPYTGTLTAWPATGQTISVKATLVPAPITTTKASLPALVPILALASAGALMLSLGRRRNNQ